MLLLTSITDKVQLVTTTVTDVHVHVDWMDIDGAGAVTTGRKNTIVSSIATTDIVPAPGSGVTRNVKRMTINSVGGSNTVTVQHTDGTTAVQLYDLPLLVSEQANVDDGDLTVYDANGALKQTASTSGCLIKTTLLTSGSTFTTQATTKTIRIKMVGGGGGGAGCTSVSVAASAGGGGGAGGYCEKTVSVLGSTVYSYGIGAAGTGTSGAAGGNGGNTTFIVGATTYTAGQGTGAALATAVTSWPIEYNGGAGGTASNGDINRAGEPGNPGLALSATPIGFSGKGGSSLMGGGGNGRDTAGTGVTATGFGGGGGGSMTGASAARAGGAGTAGAIIVEEYT